MVSEQDNTQKLYTISDLNTDLGKLVNNIENYTNTYVPYLTSVKERHKEITAKLNDIKSKIKSDSDIIITPKVVDVLTFTAEEQNSKVTLGTYGRPIKLTLEYKLVSSNGTEGDWSPYTIGKTITLTNIGDNVKFRNISTIPNDWKQTHTDYHIFDMTGKISASGGIMYLFSKDGSMTTMPEYGCYSMFSGCESLTSAPVLTATKLAHNCYYYMFWYCTSLTSGPDLYAIELADVCCGNMFRDCTSLTRAPALPATKLAMLCYYDMFKNCTSLTVAPKLPATKLAELCYYYMFSGCTSLTVPPDLHATELASGCYAYMFMFCEKLKVKNTTDPSSTVFLRTPSSIPYEISDVFTAMFAGTGGTFTENPTTNSTYSWYN